MHSGGSGCWRAWGGSFGTLGAATDGSAEGGELTAHPLLSSTSTASSGHGRVNALLSILGFLVLLLLPGRILAAPVLGFLRTGQSGQPTLLSVGRLQVGQLHARA